VSDPEERQDQESEAQDVDIPLCTCVQDPFAALPPEMRPKKATGKGDLRKVTCPGCGTEYWTNRKTDLCLECETGGR
jgi:hypothetical protein